MKACKLSLRINLLKAAEDSETMQSFLNPIDSSYAQFYDKCYKSKKKFKNFKINFRELQYLCF